MMFETEEFSHFTNDQLVQKAQLVKQRFDQKRAYFLQMRNQILIVEHWEELSSKISEFDAQYNTWNKEWAAIQRNLVTNSNISPVAKFFEKGEIFYKPLNEFIISILPQKDEEKLKAFKEEILIQIQNDILELASTVNTKIEKGIDDVLGLKSELGLEKNFGTNIANELENSNKSKKHFRTLFIGSLVFIPIFLLISSYCKVFTSLDVTELYTLRAGLSFSFVFLSYFFFTQYKLYQMMSLRYAHLSGFLGGGATFLSRLVGTEDGDVKKDINKKMADLFMQLDDISGLVKKSAHPAEVSLDKLGKLFEQMSKVTK